MSESTRDLSGIVGGLHGGKYQFGAGGAQSFVGSEFAASLASSSSAADESKEWAKANSDLPRWASALQPRPSQLAGTLDFSDSVDDELEVRVQNTYKTWEPWIAAVVSQDGAPLDASACFAVASPASGTLAPRGGANNVCDPSQPYSDAALIRVRCLAAAAAIDRLQPAFLVVKTEEEQWTFGFTK